MSGRVLITEPKELLPLPFAVTCKFVVELGENELENLLEYIDSGIGKDFIFKIFDDLPK